MRSNITSTVLVVTFAVTLLTGCAQNYKTAEQAAANACSSLGPRALSGALIGAAAGAAGGAALGAAAGNNGKSAAIGAGIGLLAGAIAGVMKGRDLDAHDCEIAQAALQKVGEAPSGKDVSWSTPQTGSHGTFKPVSETFTTASGQICRKIQASYYMSGHQAVEGDSGTVCRTNEGNWVRLENPA